MAASRFPACLADEQSSAGERTARVLTGHRRTASGAARRASSWRRIWPQSSPPAAEVALKRGRLDAVIAGLLFMAAMRRGEVSALRWAERSRAGWLFANQAVPPPVRRAVLPPGANRMLTTTTAFGLTQARLRCIRFVLERQP